jgi:hypothetical protein
MVLMCVNETHPHPNPPPEGEGAEDDACVALTESRRHPSRDLDGQNNKERSSPFKGEARRGMGFTTHSLRL